MPESSILKIIRICRDIDTAARDIYGRIYGLCDNDELKQFWKEMSEEEETHIEFWDRLETLEKNFGIPELFEDSDSVIQELQHGAERAEELLLRCEDSCSVGNAFILAYRMEFYLLHPAFELLFHTLGEVAGGPNPEKEYESHIERFINTFAKYGEVTPELELLGESLKRLWRENRILALQATRDDLTGLLNRRGFFAMAEQLAFLAQRNASTMGVMMIDFDHFKSINDRFGHEEGDAVLKATARLISDCLRTSDVAGRYGGEEFIILLSSIDEERTVQIAEKIRQLVLSNPVGKINVTISIGVAEGKIHSEPREKLHKLIKSADAALYQAKDSGRNTVVVAK
jgi:diguanylate cyclase (GGDEF)-like protein